VERTLIFPNQLFPDHPALKRGRPVLLIEDSLFFGDPHHPVKFHKQKLVFHRATMTHYARQLEQNGYTVHTLSYHPEKTLEEHLAGISCRSTLHLFFADPVDFLVRKRLQRFAMNRGAVLHDFESPAFLTPSSWNREYFGSRKQRFLTSYYKEQRKRLDILIGPGGEPEGGKWSFDEDNRKPFPKKHAFPQEPAASLDDITRKAIRSVEKDFPHNPGNAGGFWFSTTRRGALAWLRGFLDNRFHLFGDYEDSIGKDHTVLYHSVLTPYLNSGLITPREVLDHALQSARENRVPLNSLEGFVRQIIGWREFMRAMYEEHGVEMRTGNYWKFSRELPPSFYDGTTGIDPVDTIIHRCLDRCYCHHIERLMLAGNFMLLCQIHPDAVYRWFMEMFIDAYDWVMVPNVYGMSQFADGGIFTTKPYISSSNYVRKMSDYPRGPWCETWDGLFWNFIKEQESFFRHQPRLSMMTRQLDKMTPDKLKTHQENARAFLIRP